MGLPRVAQTSSLATRLLVPVGIRPGVHCRAVTTQAQGTAHLAPRQLEAPRPQPAGLQAHVSGLLADGLDWPGPGTSRVQSSPAGSTPLGSAGQVPSSILDWIRRRSSSTSCISDSWLRFGLSFTIPPRTHSPSLHVVLQPPHLTRLSFVAATFTLSLTCDLDCRRPLTVARPASDDDDDLTIVSTSGTSNLETQPLPAVSPQPRVPLSLEVHTRDVGFLRLAHCTLRDNPR